MNPDWVDSDGGKMSLAQTHITRESQKLSLANWILSHRLGQIHTRRSLGFQTDNHCAKHVLNGSTIQSCRLTCFMFLIYLCVSCTFTFFAASAAWTPGAISSTKSAPEWCPFLFYGSAQQDFAFRQIRLQCFHSVQWWSRIVNCCALRTAYLHLRLQMLWQHSIVVIHSTTLK